MNADHLRAAASACLTTLSGELLARDAQHLRHTVATLEGVAEHGALPPTLMRAMLGGPDARPASARASTLALIPLIGVLTPHVSFFSLLG
jgi:hypothetical protein